MNRSFTFNLLSTHPAIPRVVVEVRRLEMDAAAVDGQVGVAVNEAHHHFGVDAGEELRAVAVVREGGGKGDVAAGGVVGVLQFY